MTTKRQLKFRKWMQDPEMREPFLVEYDDCYVIDAIIMLDAIGLDDYLFTLERDSHRDRCILSCVSPRPPSRIVMYPIRK